MIPLRDSIKAQRFPVTTVVIIALNLVVFIHESLLGPSALEAFVMSWAVVPARLVGAIAGEGSVAIQSMTVVTSMFMHGDILHFLGNMWFLWIFGDNVEDRFGRVGFLVFYLVTGVVAALSQVAFSPVSAIPMLGASGAIAGVLGAYLRFYPHARVLAIIPIFIFFQFLEIRAVFFLGLWFLLQVASSLFGGSGVAWWAHIMGFVIGVALSLLVPRGVVDYRPRPRQRPRPRGQVLRMRR